MKIKFTQEEMDAVETAYCDNEGYLPCNISHIPEQKEYQILQKLWLKMADKIDPNTIKRQRALFAWKYLDVKHLTFYQ